MYLSREKYNIGDKNVFEDGWKCIRERTVMYPRREEILNLFIIYSYPEGFLADRASP